MSFSFKRDKDYKESFNFDEIDFQLILPVFLRNKKFIATITILTFIFSCIIAVSKKRIYEGGFEIVLDTKSKVNNGLISSPIAQLANITGVQTNNLKTEVKILESPSVLMPIYENVIKKKSKSSSKINNFSFNKWRNNNLKVDLNKGTSVLTISYRDEDKELISSVLDEMTFAYQEYSGRNLRKAQNNTKKYLESQISVYKEKSSKSLKFAQEFAIDQDLILFDFFQNNSNSRVSAQSDKSAKFQNRRQDILLNTGIEQIRVQAANEIRKIDFQISKINELGEDSKKLQYIGSTIPILVEEGLPNELKEIESKLAEMRTKYTEKESGIIQILKQRKLLIDLIKRRALGILNAEKLVAEAKMQAAMRPKGVILKYKELVREAERDESTLINLEDELRIVQLQLAKQEDSWELITKPTILKQPVAPKRKLYGLSGLSIGFILGTFLAIFREKKSDKIYNIKIFENLQSIDAIETINITNKESLLESIYFLKEVINNQPSKKVIVQPVGDFSAENQNLVNEVYEKISDNNTKEYILSTDKNAFNQSLKTEIKIFITILGEVKYSDLRKFKNRLNSGNSKFSGLIVLKK